MLSTVPSQCGGLKKRFTLSKDQVIDGGKKIFTYCPTTRKSTTAGFDDVYDNYEHFKKVVLEKMTKEFEYVFTYVLQTLAFSTFI